MVVVKRDGRRAEFNADKIKNAVLNAFKQTDGEITQQARDKASEIASYVKNTIGDETSVEDIQDIVEKKLMQSNRKDVAKEYIIYRNDRTRYRNSQTELMKVVSEKLMATNVQNQNANVDEKSFGGRMGEAQSEVAKDYALNHCVSEQAREEHINNIIYIHDLSALPVGEHNCADGSSWITIKHNGDVSNCTIKSLSDGIGLGDSQLADLSKAGYWILARDGWTKLTNITKRKLNDGEKIYRLKTRTGLPLILTEGHRLPIKRNNIEEILEVKDIRVGDELISTEDIQLSNAEIKDSFLDLTKLNNTKIDIRISNLSPLRHYLKFKYNVCLGDYMEDELHIDKKSVVLKLDDFLKLNDEYPATFEVLNKLQISSNGSRHKYPLLIPYTPQLAKLYAYIYSDGSVYEKESGSLFQLNFSNTNEDMIDDFINCFETCFGRRLNKCFPSAEYKENNSPCIRVHCGDRIITSIFREFAGGLMKGCHNMKIPDFIMCGTDEIKYAYLSAAIDCDGNMSSKNMNISTCCKGYCEQLISLLTSLGYHATMVAADKAGSKYHFNKSSRTGIRNYDSYKIQVGRNDERYRLYTNMSTIKYVDCYSYKGISKNFVESKIIDISEIDGYEDSVYDFETESHWFIINNYVSHNCITLPIDKLLANGFNTRQTDVRPAQSVSTAFQLVAVLFQLQSLQQFGGVSASHLDWSMIPYVRKSFWKHYQDGVKYIEDDELSELSKFFASCPQSIEAEGYKQYPRAYKYAMDMTEKEVYQSVEGLYHNLNTLQSRSGNQLPFTSINYGTCTEPEGRMVIQALLDVSIKGIGKLHRTPIFPCGIFQCMKGVNDKPGTPNYDLYRLALKSTSLRLYPNYVNVDWSVNEGYDRNDPKTYTSTMGCRTYNGYDINGFGQLKDGRGNIAPNTIIMPTVAMMAKEKCEESGRDLVEQFMEDLDMYIHHAKDQLLDRYELICSQSPDSAKFMYENGTMEGYIPEEGIRSALKHGTLAIGQIGLAETLQILIGCDHTTEKGMELAKRIEQLFKDRCTEFKHKYSLNFSVYLTPAENLSFTAMKKFKERYGVIPNVSENEFFTNSIHVPVWKKINPFEKIDIESQLTGYSSGGCITYVELDSSAKNNVDALETIVNYAMDHDIPYFAINVPNDMCAECGYTDEIGNECPQCGSTNIQRLRRVTGYLTGDYTTAFNLGKQDEVQKRYKHSTLLDRNFWKDNSVKS